jgi:hypothetical protein
MDFIRTSETPQAGDAFQWKQSLTMFLGSTVSRQLAIDFGT